MKKILLSVALAVPLSLIMTAILVHAADQTPGSDVKSVQPIGGSDATGKARAIKVGNDGSIVISGGTSSTLQTSSKGATAAGNVTSTAASADRQPLDVTIRDTSGAAVTSFGAANIATASKGATAGGNPTSTTASSTRQPLDVTYYDSSGNPASATNPIPVQQAVGGSAVSVANPVPVTQSIGGSAIAAANPVPMRAYDGSGNALGTSANPTVAVIRTGFMKTGAPSFSVAVSSSSAAATGLTAGGCYRVACSATVYFRSGTGTPTALTTDNPFFGPSVEKVCIPATDSALAFVTSTGTGTCAGTIYAVTP